MRFVAEHKGRSAGLGDGLHLGGGRLRNMVMKPPTLFGRQLALEFLGSPIQCVCGSFQVLLR